MKKLILPIVFILCFASGYSQVPSDTTDLRAKINSWLVTNGTKQITATQVNQLFNGVASLMKAYAVDSGYRIADTLFLVRRGGFTTIKITLNTGGAPSETDPTVPTVAKALTGADTSRWNNKQDALTQGAGISIVANVISANMSTAQWNANMLQGNNIATASPSTGQVLKWNGSAWGPGTDSLGVGGGGGSNDTLSHLNVAYVETTGSDVTGRLNNPAKPFLTLNAALDALPSSGGKIQIGLGEFMVPDTAKIKSNVWFSGSGMGTYNDTITVSSIYNNSYSTVTKTIGGTRLHGFFYTPPRRNNMRYSNFSIDNGSEWINANNAGVALDCFGLASKYGPGLNSADGFHLLQTSSSPRTGVVVENVRALVKGPTDLVHAFIFEDVINPDVSNLYSCYGFAGIVIKSIGGVYRGLHAFAHSDAGIYIKSNDYSFSWGVVLDGFEIRSVGVYDGGGLHINAADAASPGLFFTVISNGFIDRTKYGVKSAGGIIDNIHIANVSVASAQTNGFETSPLLFSNIIGCSARSCGGDGFHIVANSSGEGPFLSDCFTASNGGDGIDISGTANAVHLDNFKSYYNSGYGVRTTNGNTLVGVHTEFGNSLGAVSGTLISKLFADPISIYAGTSQFIFGPGSSNKSSLFSNSLASYIVDNGTYTASQFIPSSTRQSGLMEFSLGGFRFYNSASGGASPMSPVRRFDLDSVGHLFLPTAQDSTSAPTNMMWRDEHTGQVKLAAVPASSSYTFTNGLANSSGTVSLGGALTGTTTIDGASNGLNLGSSGSKLSSVNIWSSGRINLLGQVQYGVEDYSTDADHTLTANANIIELHDNLTANRTLTMPTASQQGQTLTIVLRYSSGSNHFNLASAITDNSTGTTFTQLDWGKTYDFYVHSSAQWLLIRKY